MTQSELPRQIKSPIEIPDKKNRQPKPTAQIPEKKEQIDFHPDWHRLNRQNGEGEKRITDSSFTVTGIAQKLYLLELQSTADNSMLIRFSFSHMRRGFPNTIQMRKN